MPMTKLAFARTSQNTLICLYNYIHVHVMKNREAHGKHAVTYFFWPWKTGLLETLVKVDRLPMQSDGISAPSKLDFFYKVDSCLR